MTQTPAPSIVIAPDSFKGTATAIEASNFIAGGIKEVLPQAQIELCPMADGGEGTAELFDGQTITLPTTDAAGRLTEASYVFRRSEDNPDDAEAFIDIAAASGLPAVQHSPVPATGDTYGTGVLIADALERGAKRINLCLGGSATVDAGTGILVALGCTPMNEAGHPLRQGGGALIDFSHFDLAQLNMKVPGVEWVFLCDVDAPATGPDGAAHQFGPQKGASPEEVKLLDRALSNFCEKLDIDPNQQGLGAAGGIPIAISWLGSVLHPGAQSTHFLPGSQVIAREVGLPEACSGADIVVTGEGAFDAQSLRGKVVGTVANFAGDSQLAIVAGNFREQPEEDMWAIELIKSQDVREQLIQAGRDIAERWIAKN